MSFDTIDLLTGHVFQVTWDTGRRCNYDCSYCPMHRHDNFSAHATFDQTPAAASSYLLSHEQERPRGAFWLSTWFRCAFRPWFP